MKSEYIIETLNLLLITVSMFVLFLTSYNGLAALIYIMPMIVETLKETAKKKEKRIECIVDVIGLLSSSAGMILIVAIMLGFHINSNFAIATIAVYPFYKTFQVVVLYRREE